MASVAAKLSRVTCPATNTGGIAPRLTRRIASRPPCRNLNLNGDTTFTAWSRPLFRCPNAVAAAAASNNSLDLFLRRCIVTLPSGEDSTGHTRLPVSAAPEDLEDELRPDPDTVPSFDEKDLASDETLWALYERWCRFHEIVRDHDEMTRRFGHFKKSARYVYEFNRSGRSYTLGLTRCSDLEPEEYAPPRRVPRPPRTGSRVFYNDKGEITALCTRGYLKKYS